MADSHSESEAGEREGKDENVGEGHALSFSCQNRAPTLIMLAAAMVPKIKPGYRADIYPRVH